MQIFLMQHGVAVPGAEDPARPLTEAGALEVRRVVERARAAGVRVDRCVHSGKLRAAQTAGILTSGLGAAEPEDRAGLGPSDPGGLVALFPKDVALVPEDGAGGFSVAWVLVPEVA